MGGSQRDPAADSLSDSFLPILGFGQGLSAYLIAYVLVGGLMFVEAASTGQKVGLAGLVAGTQGWLSASHLGAVGGASALASQERLVVPAVVYYSIPAVLLAYNGRAVVRQAVPSSGRAAAVAGASVLVGYLVGLVAVLPVVSLLSTLVALVLGDPAMEVPFWSGGHVFRVTLVAGLVYPAVFGSLGGYLAYRWR